MQIAIKGLKQLDKLGKQLENAREKALISATNKMARKAGKDSKNAVREKYTIKKISRFSEAVRLTPAKRGRLFAVLQMLDNKPIGYASYKNTVSKKLGVSVQIRKDKPKFRLKKSFKATANLSTGQIFARSDKPGETAKDGYRTRADYSNYQGQRRDKVLRPKGPSPNRMMRDVGFPAIDERLDVEKFASDLSTILVLQLKKKGFR